MLNFDGEIAGARRVLDATTLRANVVLHNLANANTPAFKRYEVRFEDELRQAVARGEDAGSVNPRVVRDTSGDPKENNVDPTEELALLRKVETLHQVFTRRLGGYFGHLKRAIQGRA